MSESKRRKVIGCAAALIVVFYFLVAYARPTSEAFPTEKLYNMLTDSFLAGQVSLFVPPDPAILAMDDPYQFNVPHRLHDASLYQGRYYLYFGPGPVLFLLLPFRVVTGHHLPAQLAVPIFCSLGFLFSTALFFALKRAGGWNVPLWLEILIVVCLGNTGPVCYLLTRPMVYETAIAGGYCFLMAGFFFLAKILDTQRVSRFLPLAGVCFGIAIACRFNLVLVAAVMAVVTGIWLLRSQKTIAVLATFLAPIALTGIGLGIYNYERFGNPLETGRQYQLTTVPIAPGTHEGVHLSFATFLPALKGFLFTLPEVDSTYPYLYPANMSPYPGFDIPSVYEPMMGLLPTTPIVIPGFLCFWLLRRRRGDRTIRMIESMAFSALMLLCLLSLIGWIIVRYLMDFTPMLTVASCCTMVILWQDAGGSRIGRWSRYVFPAAAAWSIVFAYAIEIPGPAAVESILDLFR